MSSHKKSKPIKSNSLYFDKLLVNREIEKKNEYKEDNIIIKKWDCDDIYSNMYCAKILTENTNFLGILNELFEREGYCLNIYTNGDSYFGYYSNNLRDKHGFYEFKPEIKKKIRNQEFYFGLWKDDLRNNRGINLWISEPEKNIPFSNFDDSDFECYVGLFENDNFIKGTYLIKNEDDYYVYHGNFDEEGNKYGNNCLLYSSTLEQCFYGKFQNNEFIKGYVCKYDNEGNVNDLCKYENEIIIKEEELNKNNINDISKLLFIFRNVIMGKDYFGDIYNCFGKAYNFKINEMKNIDILNNDKYLDIMTAAICYNKVTIFNDIEKFVF